MNVPELKCDPDLLQRWLSDSLSEAQEESLARHLTECPACQRQLDELAASNDQWRRIGGVLSREASGAEPPATLPLGTRAGEPHYRLAEDFAVDFLEPAERPGQLGRLGEFEILEVIGFGGMGIVLRGFQPELNRPVAVKVLAPHLATSGAARQRFAREAQAAAVIVHPNVMPILTVSSSGKLPHLVMPYVACESLQQRLDREGPLELLDILRIGLQTARGLAAAHAQGLVHRDIKPANILLERGVDRALLTDFGLARAVDDATLTRTGVIAGTPQYMSPEQARGDAVDPRSDLFSLGSVLYAMCTGRPPFRAETSYGILRRVTDAAARPIRDLNPSIPAWLAAIVDKLLAKEPRDRYTTADALAAQLEACLAHVQQPTVCPLPAELRSAAQWRSPRARLFVACVALPVALLLVWGAAAGWRMIGSEAGPPARTAENPNLTTAASEQLDSASVDAWGDDAARRLTEMDMDLRALEADAATLFEDSGTDPVGR